ncbi:MAG: hypothetical protein R3A44_39145 [Caldilineaceae bacterium]
MAFLLMTNLLYWFDAKWIIDPIVNAVGRFGIWLSHVGAEFDRLVVDGLVNGAAGSQHLFGGWLRSTWNSSAGSIMVVAVSMMVWLLLAKPCRSC